MYRDLVTPQDEPSATLAADPAIAQEASYLTIVMAERLKERYTLHAASLGLTHGQIKVLLALDPDEPLAMRALADRLHFDPSNLTSLIDKLEARGLLERRPDPIDRRVKSLVVTTAGVDLRESFRQRLAADPGLLGQLPAAQLARYRDILREALNER
jgi:DNA-binding MarR family transcriptional regulator